MAYTHIYIIMDVVDDWSLCGNPGERVEINLIRPIVDGKRSRETHSYMQAHGPGQGTCIKNECGLGGKKIPPEIKEWLRSLINHQYIYMLCSTRLQAHDANTHKHTPHTSIHICSHSLGNMRICRINGQKYNPSTVAWLSFDRSLRMYKKGSGVKEEKRERWWEGSLVANKGNGILMMRRS